MSIALNRFIRKQRRRLLMLAAMLALAGIVVGAHSVMGSDHMGSDAVMCVAVLEVGAIAIAGIAAGPPRALLSAVWEHLPLLHPALPLLAAPPEPRARAAPTVLQVFRL